MNQSEASALLDIARRSAESMSGYYNDNIEVNTPNGPVLVRIPVARADQMDLRIWHESQILAVLPEYVEHVPELLHVSDEPPFQIHGFVSGHQLDEMTPRGERVPGTVIPGVLNLFGQLGDVPLTKLPPLPEWWPTDGDCAGFAALLSDVTSGVTTDFGPEFGILFRALGIPDDPLRAMYEAWPSLTRRPFRLVHSDVHRQNIILADSSPVFLDWELALWGDPVYELAVHIHKMAYLDDELAVLLDGWPGMAGPAGARSWDRDLQSYLAHEKVKSAIVDSVRYTKEIIAPGTGPERRRALIHKLAAKVNAARTVWELNTSLSPADVGTAIDRWHRSAPRADTPCP